MTRKRGTTRLSKLLQSTCASYDSDMIETYRVVRHSKSTIRISRHRKGNKHRDYGKRLESMSYQINTLQGYLQKVILLKWKQMMMVVVDI